MFENTIAPTANGLSATERSQGLRTILYAGLIAGAMDITAALINSKLHGGAAVRVLQSIAGGLLGRDAYQGGWKTAALGFVLHFCIATIWAAIYYAASLKLPLLTRQAVWCGLVYGVVVYLAMYSIVLPLSALRLPVLVQAPAAMLAGILIHLCCIGLPIALVTRWQSRKVNR